MITQQPTPPGETIKHLLECNGLTQKELAEKMGISPQKVFSLLSGNIKINAKIASKLEQVFPDRKQWEWLIMEKNYKQELDQLRKMRANPKKALIFDTWAKINQLEKECQELLRSPVYRKDREKLIEINTKIIEKTNFLEYLKLIVAEIEELKTK